MCDFYVNDLFTSVSHVATGIKLRDKLINLLNAGGFELRKWASNEKLLISKPEDNISTRNFISLDK